MDQIIYKIFKKKLRGIFAFLHNLRISIRYKISAGVFIIVLIPMLVAGFYFYWGISSILTKNANDTISQLILQTTNNLENAYDIINNTTYHFVSNKSIRDWASGDVPMEEEEYNLMINKINIEEELKYSLMFNNAWNMKIITSAYIFLNDSTYSSVVRSAQNSQTIYENNFRIYQQVSSRNERGLYILPPANEDNMIYFTRTVFNIYKPSQRLFLIIGTDENQISNKFEGLVNYPGSMAYIIDDNGVIYSSSDDSKLGKTVDASILYLKQNDKVTSIHLEGQEYFAASRKISDSNLTFIIGIPKKQILARLSSTLNTYIYITIFIVLLLLIASFFLSLRLTHFIKDMLHNFNRVRAGDYLAKMPLYKDSELYLLSETFNNMTHEIEYLINQVYEKQLLLKETEFKFLQSQMNPHFLFNTLMVIGYKAKLLNEDSVYRMVTSLTELLQASIYVTNKDKVSIRQELDYVNFYLYLQKNRFEDRLEYKINISDDSLLSYYVPKLSIQPIVENAVVHGLETKQGVGMIDIHIWEENHSVYFQITDDGIGFDLDNLEFINKENIVKKGKNHNSIGLNNTNKRINLIYGESYGITVESTLNVGSKVTVRIPVDRGNAIHV